MNKRMNKLLAILLASTVLCVRADTPELERRAAALSDQLRCVVCQNQTIADSQAELAVDLRRQVREQLRQGRSDEQVIDYVVQRYGHFVLYRPPFMASTLLLWCGPALLLLGGLGALALRLRRRHPPCADTGADLAGGRRLLEEGDEA